MEKRSVFAGKVSYDAQRQKERTGNKSYGVLNIPKGVDVFSAEPGGKITLDIIPYVVTDPKHPDYDEERQVAVQGDLWYKRPYFIHRNIGSASENVVCLTSFGERCPICEHRNKLIKKGAEKEDTDALKKSLRNLYVVITPGKGDEKPMIWDISQFNFEDLLTDEINENRDYEVFPDLKIGYSLRIRFDSQTIGKSQPFAQASRIDFIEREYAYPDNLTESVPNLDAVLKRHTYKELEELFFELPKATDAEDEEGEGVEANEEKSYARQPKVVEKEEAPIRRERTVGSQKVEREERPTRTRVEKVEETEQEEEETSVRRTKKIVHEEPKQEETEDGDGQCPKGHRYGIDTDTKEDCKRCKIWDECFEEKESRG
jgi:hypothetical protein